MFSLEIKTILMVNIHTRIRPSLTVSTFSAFVLEVDPFNNTITSFLVTHTKLTNRPSTTPTFSF